MIPAPVVAPSGPRGILPPPLPSHSGPADPSRPDAGSSPACRARPGHHSPAGSRNAARLPWWERRFGARARGCVRGHFVRRPPGMGPRYQILSHDARAPKRVFMREQRAESTLLRHEHTFCQAEMCGTNRIPLGPCLAAATQPAAQ